MTDKASESFLSQGGFNRELRRFESTFLECLETVLGFKDGTGTPEGMQTFQPHLFAALLRLSRGYHGLRIERESLLARKAQLSAAFHARRQKQLASRQDVLLRAIGVGRNLGDSFLWFFYRNDPELLRRHRQQSPPSPPPAGDGGEGELALVDAVRFLGDKYVLFHGITTLFRLGDASLLDMGTHRIAGIGELKTTRIDDKTLNLQFVASMNTGFVFPGTVSKPSALAPPLDPKRQARLNKQLDTISRVASAAEKPPVAKVELHAPMMAHVNELSSIVKDVRLGHAVIRQLSPGLVVVGVASRRRTLSARLRDPAFESVREALPDLADYVRKLALPDSPYNCTIIGDVFYGSEWQPFLVGGATPPLLWPADSAAQRSLATGGVKLITLFNPAHMLADLINKGISIAKFEPPSVLSLSLEIKKRTLTLEHAETFLQLVYTSLYREEYAVHVACETLRRLLDHPGNQATRIDLTLSHDVFFSSDY